MPSLATCLGHPRIGVGRELKKALETFWAKKTSAADLERVATAASPRHWSVMKAKGIDVIPSNDFSLYDHMLDMAVTVGAVPERYRGIADPLGRYFAMARGSQDRDAGIDVSALEMTKWFDTNYHYIVPELAIDQLFRLDAAKILAEIDEARALGIEPRPVVPGPVTFLTALEARGGRAARSDHPRSAGRGPARLRRALWRARRQERGLGSARRAVPGARTR